MANTFLTPDIIAKEALMVLENNLVMAVSETSGFILKNRQTGSRRFALLPVLVKRMKRQKSFSRKGKSTV